METAGVEPLSIKSAIVAVFISFFSYSIKCLTTFLTTSIQKIYYNASRFNIDIERSIYDS